MAEYLIKDLNYVVCEIYRCKECGHGKQICEDGAVWCSKHGQIWPQGAFCSYGEAKKDVQKD